MHTAFVFEQPGQPQHGAQADAIMNRIADDTDSLDPLCDTVDQEALGGVLLAHLVGWQQGGRWPAPDRRLAEVLGTEQARVELEALPSLLAGTGVALCSVSREGIDGTRMVFLAPEEALAEASPPVAEPEGCGCDAKCWLVRTTMAVCGAATLAAAIWLAQVQDVSHVDTTQVAMETTTGATVTRGQP